jgi:hypothetical protein
MPASGVGGPVGATEETRWLTRLDAARQAWVKQVLSADRPDPAGLHKIDWGLAAYWWRDCQRCCCRLDWQETVMGDGPFYDYTLGFCPTGHHPYAATATSANALTTSMIGAPVARHPPSRRVPFPPGAVHVEGTACLVALTLRLPRPSARPGGWRRSMQHH